MGARSNSGEGGEEQARNVVDVDGNSRKSAIRQVASGRFGVTAEYLVHAQDLQIKIAQGAKPGEGGQLPGKKVDERIAKVRHTTPGTTLISPPPHHDIYSIEDLSQLIYDLQSVSPSARISVKLVAAIGVGNVAAGVAKAGAGAVVVAGFEGGTGAAPLSSLRHAGLPWELGLAETQQQLRELGLRGRVRLQCDGGIRTPRDVVMAVLLGAEELGLATAALIAEGCVMQRKCHLNTCSVGIATQDPALRAKFPGKPEHIVTFFLLVAEGVRAILAKLGARSVDDVVGRVELLRRREKSGGTKADALDLSVLLRVQTEGPRKCERMQRKDVNKHFDGDVDAIVEKLRAGAGPIVIEAQVKNTDRAIGSRLAGAIARAVGDSGFDDDSVTLRLHGSAGQSLGAFMPKGISIVLRGEANDTVGKGLCGGLIAVASTSKVPEDDVIFGNTALYGATAGFLYVNGIAGERFAVRNSGAWAVVEGVGDHGCEYMTGGIVAVLGRTGRNFAAGMTGGEAFVLVVDGKLSLRLNHADAIARPLVDDDDGLLLSLLRKHVSLTGSPLGSRLLADWPNARARFRVVTAKPVVVVREPTLRVVA
jgi:glutamate synthase (NADPH/NADH) large chain